MSMPVHQYNNPSLNMCTRVTKEVVEEQPLRAQRFASIKPFAGAGLEWILIELERSEKCATF